MNKNGKKQKQGPRLKSRYTKPEIFMSLSHSVFSQSGPQKAPGRVGWGGRVVLLAHFMWSKLNGQNFMWSKLDEKSIENGPEFQKCSVKCLFWLVATTLILQFDVKFKLFPYQVFDCIS